MARTAGPFDPFRTRNSDTRRRWRSPSRHRSASTSFTRCPLPIPPMDGLKTHLTKRFDGVRQQQIFAPARAAVPAACYQRGRRRRRSHQSGQGWITNLAGRACFRFTEKGDVFTDATPPRQTTSNDPLKCLLAGGTAPQPDKPTRTLGATPSTGPLCPSLTTQNRHPEGHLKRSSDQIALTTRTNHDARTR